MKKITTIEEFKKGQILLVVVLLLATMLTVVMTVVFTSRTETQSSKLQQEADKSLVAAEAGVEAAIKSLGAGSTQSFSDLNLGSLQSSGIDVTNSKVSADNTQRDQFVSPVILKDQQYTLYLTNYDNGNYGGNAFTPKLQVYYGSGINCNNLALEITVVSFTAGDSSSPVVSRFVADTGRLLGSDGAQIGSATNLTIKSTVFNCVTSAISLPNNAKLLFARVLGSGASTRIGINDGQLPVQGKYFTAEAKTTSGVTKKIKLFQSYPQLPAELFVTSF
jgi:uncharacterized protein (UPF0333 family)